MIAIFFLQLLLPLAICGIVPANMYDTIVELGIIFRQLCSKVLKMDEQGHLNLQIPITFYIS